jgi:hypothetical protein
MMPAEWQNWLIAAEKSGRQQAPSTRWPNGSPERIEQIQKFERRLV